MTGRPRFEYTITGNLETQSPLHIGSLDSLAVDRPVVVDGAGTPIIPGTALAGVLQAQIGPNGNLWGGNESTSTASLITIDDALLINSSSDLSVEVRDGVSINRRYGTAEPGYLYTKEVLPTGSVFSLNITINCDTQVDTTQGIEHHPVAVQKVLAALTNGVSVGSGSTKGFGAVKLTKPTVTRRDRSSAADLKRLVSGEAFGAISLDDWTTKPTNPALERTTIKWRPLGPILVKDEPEGDAIDVLPLITAGSDGLVHLVIPGSSIKGALRSHAERILRSVLEIDTPSKHEEVLQATDEMLPVGLLFGQIGDGKAGVGRKGALRVSETTSVQGWKANLWADVSKSEKFDDADNNSKDTFTNLQRALNALQEDSRAPFVIGCHVAIDRWTGGAHEGALYSILEPWITCENGWTPITIDLDHNILREQSDQATGAARVLLSLVLKDFCEGWIPLGYGVNKGYGALEASIDCPDGDCPDGASPLTELSKDLLNAWTTWIAEQKKEIKNELEATQ